ncbi:hypothetical protein, partial [Micromonospora sp. NPDC049799]|uniref:hypothetical protein n=1 Tax=Micromonospora sp. NPDC049799 TaxID=3154741 RepID=UPI0033D9DF1B
MQGHVQSAEPVGDVEQGVGFAGDGCGGVLDDDRAERPPGVGWVAVEQPGCCPCTAEPDQVECAAEFLSAGSPNIS